MPIHRILVTRAPHQASDLADRLRALGAEPILIPTIELTAPTTFAPLDAALASLSTYDWLLFTSANAVTAFHSRQRTTHNVQLITQATPRIAAIGPATARALEAIGLTPDLIPPQAVAESLTEALLPHAKPGTRFLLIRAESARDHLPETLTAAGAEVTIAPAYQTIAPAGSSDALRTLFTAQPPDAITFTSSSSVRNLFELLAAADLTLPPQIIRASIGPITSTTLRDLGFPPHMESTAPDVATLALNLTLYLNSSPLTTNH